MDRREFLRASTVAAAAGALAPTADTAAPTAGASLGDELSLAGVAAAFASGSLSSRQLTQTYLDRIEALDHGGPMLRAVLELNPRALDHAAALDEELRARGSRGALHGVPILVKDNVETGGNDMMTTAGSLALQGWYPNEDAPLVARLRQAGAVILGKTNMSEWANFRSTHALSGWSARGGQTKNPYDNRRSPSGSSSGSAVAVAANLCMLAVGTETNGSIVSPASVNGIVGLKPTVGLVSRRGVVPLSHSQDTAGPLARSVRDAAIMLGGMSGLDTLDRAGAAAKGHFRSDYAHFVHPDGLRGARLGVARRYFADNAPLSDFLDAGVEALRTAGAHVVDPADLPTSATPELEVLLYEFKSDLNAYLQRLPSTLPVRSLGALIRFNEAHHERELALFDQELLRRAEAKGPLSDARYLQARAACVQATRGGIDAVLGRHGLDAIVSLTAGPAWLIDTVNGDAGTGGCSAPAAIAGYPHITVPAGLFRGLPIGLSFFGTAFSEPTLIRLASGFESSTRARVPPRL